ncbi:Tetratricopeptide (plasmid) [Nostoc flagelliforme CCNUN1]|uniref:Tetratricopeptide n=1 Tax=Nostoc flagelliforme CCNUN1 TaxID=2038116 RepID=A0A2K8TAX8_9NOSO|nr:DUF4365 domain-containing protein [Nostoc flagelliforme]AUB44847.1 Tetratricopeptide [Nostoc flagelliforme CCNUN1]
MPPKRPREHQLESESRLAFQKKLPSQWLFKPIEQPEYGLDAWVEIFDNADFATGKIFFVQLKATDKPKLKDALAVKLEISTCEYYRSLDLPILIVRYYASTDKIYVKWFHSYDPYYGRNAKKSITFRLSIQDEWQEETAARLVLESEAFRELKSPDLVLPIKFRITLIEQYIHGVLAAQIQLEIHKALEKFLKILTISNSFSEKVHGSIVIDNDKAEIYLASGTGFTLHTSTKQKDQIDISKFVYDIIIGIGVAVENTGHSNIASRIFAEFAASSSIIIQPEILLIVVNCMIRAHRVTEALQLSEKLGYTEASLVASEMLTLPALSQRQSLSDNEQNYVQNFLERYIEQVVKFGDSQKIATAHYNLGNYLESRNFKRLALHHYIQVIKHYPEYLERRYFCRELAGILFESKRYSLAIKFYERALSLGEEGVCLALYADALMFAGKYRESQQAFYAYLVSHSDFESEWRLKACVLVLIYSLLGCDEQKRHIDAAIKLATPNAKSSAHEYREKLEVALRHDALCGYAWFNLGVLESQTGNQDSAFISFLIAALINTGDVEAWCNSIAIGIYKSYDSLVSDIIITAYQRNGNNLMEQMISFAQSQTEGFPVTDFLTVFNEVLNQVPRPEEQFKVRLLGEGADFYTFNFADIYGNERFYGVNDD